MIDAAPAHVGDVQQAVDAAQVDERAEVGDVLDDALAELADFELLEQLGLLLRPLGLDEAAAADDDVAAGFVDLEHQALDLFADVFADVVRPADIDLAGRQEHVDADVDQQAALDLARDLPLTTSPSWTVSMTFIHFSIFSALRLVRTIMPRSSCRPAMSSMSSTRTRIVSPISGIASPSSHSLRGMMPSLL